MKFTKFLFTSVLIALLNACGGGGSSGSSEKLGSPEKMIQAPLSTPSEIAPALNRLNSPQIRNQSYLITSVQNSPGFKLVGNVLADNLFDWAEQSYPEYFPSIRSTQEFGDFVYRFYPESETYIGIDGKDKIYLISPKITNNKLTLVGGISSFESAVKKSYGVKWELPLASDFINYKLISNNISQDLKLDDVSSWGNQLASIKWDYMLTPSANFSLKAYVTNYTYSHSHLYSNKQTDLFGNQKLEKSLYVISNGLRDIEYSAHLKKQLTHKLAAKIGMGYILHTFIPNKRVITSETDSVKTEIVYQDNLLTTPEVFSYLTLEYHNPKWGYYDFGIRGVYYGLGYGQYYILPEPRISIRYALPGNLWLKVAASQTRQFFHQLKRDF